MAKIKYFEKAWKKANDWANETGQGVKETDPEGYDAYLCKLCKYYFVLYDVMVSRSSSRAVASTNDIMLGISDDGESSENSSVCTVVSDGSDAFQINKPTKRKAGTPLSVKKKKRGKTSNVELDFGVDLFKKTTDIEESKLTEMKRYNLAVEHQGSYKAKMDMHHYKMKLLTDFRVLKADDMGDEDICKIFPDMKMFTDGH